MGEAVFVDEREHLLAAPVDQRLDVRLEEVVDHAGEFLREGERGDVDGESGVAPGAVEREERVQAADAGKEIGVALAVGEADLGVDRGGRAVMEVDEAGDEPDGESLVVDADEDVVGPEVDEADVREVGDDVGPGKHGVGVAEDVDGRGGEFVDVGEIADPEVMFQDRGAFGVVEVFAVLQADLQVGRGLADLAQQVEPEAAAFVAGRARAHLGERLADGVAEGA